MFKKHKGKDITIRNHKFFTKAKTVTINRDELEEAMEKFLKKGGKIKVLPAQIAVQDSTVGRALDEVCRDLYGTDDYDIGGE